MKKIINLIFLVILFNSTGHAQENNKILLSIDDRDITQEEFLRIYKKNNQNIQSGQKTDIEEYMDMFINFKLKVIEAENTGIDTIPSVKMELEKYKNQLAQPYLLDSQVLNSLIKEAYERSKKEVRASHILIKLPDKLSYEDTLRAFEKAEGIKRRIVKKGEDFKEVAKATSDDPSVKANSGDVGYFSAFRMVYPFEDAVYSLEVGEVSSPVKTRFGYHIIKKTGQRPAKGKIKVAHIMLLAPNSMSEKNKAEKKEKINEIYHELMSGKDFKKMAEKYSEDKGSARDGGELPWFGVGRMVPEFEEAAFSLDNKGEISKPVKTSVGWHIIKLIDKEEIGTFEESKVMIKRKVQNDQRYQLAQDSLIEDLKTQYNYQLDSNSILKLQNKLLDEDFNLYLNRTNDLISDQTDLFKFDDKNYKISHFAEYLNDLPKEIKSNYEGKYLLDKSLERYVTNEIIEFEKAHLKKKHTNYKYVVKEYHDGILLFEIMDRKIWSKASEDSAGLRNFYEDHKENYKWNERYKGNIYFCEDQSTLKKVKKMKKGGLFRKSKTDEEILNTLNTEDHKKVKIREGTFRKGDNPVIDYHAWKIGERSELKSKEPYFVTGKIVPSTTKTLEEARGAVIADYQNYLEKKWINELRDKYEININQGLLNKLKENMN